MIFSLKQKRPKVFLSYSHKDIKSVRTLWSRLRKDCLDVWFDKDNLQPGENWANKIRNAILSSDFVIVCLSHQFTKSKGFRHQELKIALEKAKILSEDKIFIIPIRLQRCEMPKSLQHLHRVDLFTKGGYKKLLNTLLKSST